MKRTYYLIAIAMTVAATGSIRAEAYEPGRTGFAVLVDGTVSPFRVMTYSVMPGESLTVQVDGRKPAGDYSATASSGDLEALSTFSWRWTAPQQPGNYTLTINRAAPSPDTMTLNLFVMVAAKNMKKGYLNGYRIGQYPKKPYKNLPQYLPPTGFIEVTEANLNLRVSPHFTLGQFMCKQDGAFPRYLLLRTELLLKLELVLQQVNEKGYPCNSFHIMSGFRTPHYNKAIGNVKYSRHQWGGAADIFIDENPKDSMMDDLTRDRRIDWRDAAVLYDIVDDMRSKSWYMPYVGGLGRYRKTNNHGPFVHIDVRGFLARWGD